MTNTQRRRYRSIDHQIASEVMASTDNAGTLSDLRKQHETADHLGLTAAQVLASPNTGMEIENMVSDIFEN